MAKKTTSIKQKKKQKIKAKKKFGINNSIVKKSNPILLVFGIEAEKKYEKTAS